MKKNDTLKELKDKKLLQSKELAARDRLDLNFNKAHALAWMMRDSMSTPSDIDRKSLSCLLSMMLDHLDKIKDAAEDVRNIGLKIRAAESSKETA